MSNFQLFTIPQFGDWLKQQKVSRLIRLVQNHHTFIPDYGHFNGGNHLALQKSMEHSHLERGFSEIAQHFTLFPDGTIMTGRSLNTIPAGIKGANANGICLEHLGNFNKDGDDMTESQRDAILTVNAMLLHKFGLAPSGSTIKYHHWFDLNTGKELETEGTGTTKTCPGTNFFGGNTRAAFQTHFLPEVQREFNALALPAAPSPVYNRTGTVRAKSLNIRTKPSIESAIIGTLSKGTEVRIFDELDGWYAISSSQSRWVKTEYIENIKQNPGGS